MKPWLVHVLRTTGAALPVLAAAVLLAMNSAGAFTDGTVNRRHPSFARAPAPRPSQQTTLVKPTAMGYGSGTMPAASPSP